MRIGHCQIEVKTDFDANLAKVLTYLERAAKDRIEIVCFPECCLTGYPDTEELARKGAFSADSPQVMKVLDKTAKFDCVTIVGLNELRGKDLYNTAIVVYKGHLLGSFSKCSAYQKFHKQGREFPVFEHKGVKFGVIICSDGGYIEGEYKEGEREGAWVVYGADGAATSEMRFAKGLRVDDSAPIGPAQRTP